MMDTISIFIPLRSGSQRIKGKNHKKFAPNGDSLFEFKLNQILKIHNEVFEIVVSTDDPIIIEKSKKYKYSIPNLRVVKRENQLCLGNTKVSDLIKHAEENTLGSEIFWIHVTSPFVDHIDYLSAISKYKICKKEKKGDSLMSVNKIQQFIWDDSHRIIINNKNKANKWPNTQDLKPLYEINHAFYINSRNNYINMKDRIGLKPSLYICDGIKSIDIDWPNDFKLAQELIPFYEKD